MDRNSSETIFDLEYFFELSPDLLCIAGYDGYFKKINPAVSRTLGFNNAELLSRPINSFVHPDDQNITHEKRESIKKDNPLLNFENRYVTISGEVVWLSWTAMPIKRDKLVFAIAKNITYKKKLHEFWRISDGLGISATGKLMPSEEKMITQDESDGMDRLSGIFLSNDPSPADQIWLETFENIVRKHIANIDLNLLCHEMAVSERALFRRVNRTVGITPNRLIRIIRLQVASEAIRTGKYRTVSEISAMAGFSTPAYFSKIFGEVYGIDILKVLKL
jgi:PAS domain S-box-containing protein